MWVLIVQVLFVSSGLLGVTGFSFDELMSEHRVKRKLPYVPYGYRPGKATETNSCQKIRGVPASLRSKTNMKPGGLTTFYQKYTEAYGIPVVSSSVVSDNALRRACYVLRFLLADNAAIRQWFYRLFGRVAVIGQYEGTTSIPENSNLGSWWNQRSRGLGATPHSPCSSGGEENLLCLKGDRYYNEDIFLHESAHGVHLIGAAFAIKNFDSRLQAAFSSARSTGKWRSTYSMTDKREYFAEGVQSFFNVNAYSKTPNGIHNHVSTRALLKSYDPPLYRLIQEVFPCQNIFLKRCESTRAKEVSTKMKMNCKVGGGGGKVVGGKVTTGGSKVTKRPTVTKPKATKKPTIVTDKFPNCKDARTSCPSEAKGGGCNNSPAILSKCKRSCRVCGPHKNINCVDKHVYCASWSQRGECDINPSYMNLMCVKSCLC